jgi:hypothetical protein
MRKSLLSLVVGMAVFLAGFVPEPAAFAQKGSSRSSSSGRSYSSGSSSPSRSTSTSGRSYSSGSSSSRPSSSPGATPKPSMPSKPSTPPSRSSPSGKSYSTTGKTSPAAPSSSRPPAMPTNKPDGPKSTPGPSSSFPAKTSPRVATYDEAAAAAQRREQSRIDYKTRPSDSAAAPSGPPAAWPTSPPVHPSGKSYSRTGYDTAAADAKQRDESRIAYQAGQAPKPTYKTPTGIDRPVEPTHPQVVIVRKTVTPDLWRTRHNRIDWVYGPYYGYPPIVYNDPYNSFFWYWLLAQNLDTQASWAYHHRDIMDQARYRDLLAKNAELAARVQQLEKGPVARDPSYTPPGIEPDLVYSDNYVDAAYNPQPSPTVPADWPTSNGDYGPSTQGAVPVAHIWRTLWRGLFTILAVMGTCFFLIWLIFIKRWGGDDTPVANPNVSRRGQR